MTASSRTVGNSSAQYATTAVSGESLRATATKYRKPRPRSNFRTHRVLPPAIRNGIPASDLSSRCRKSSSKVTTHAQIVVRYARCSFFRNRFRIHPRPLRAGQEGMILPYTPCYRRSTSAGTPGRELTRNRSITPTPRQSTSAPSPNSPSAIPRRC
jgi:hypothetical protein